MQKYDFKAARERIVRFTTEYRRLKQRGFPAETLDFLASAVKEIEQEIAAAHETKIVAMAGDYESLINIIPSILQFQYEGKEDLQWST